MALQANMDTARDLLPGLQFLANEAQAAGLTTVSMVLVDAIVRISEMIDDDGAEEIAIRREGGVPTA